MEGKLGNLQGRKEACRGKDEFKSLILYTDNAEELQKGGERKWNSGSLG